MSRLSSFRAPSTPTPSPVRQPNQGRSTPNSPSNQIESTYHRKVRSCLQDIRAVTETWEDLVLLDGLKSLKNLVDTRTDLECDFLFPCEILGAEKIKLLIVVCKWISNELAQTSNRLPRTYIVSPALETMDQCIANLDTVIGKLVSTDKGSSTGAYHGGDVIGLSKSSFENLIH